MIKIQEYLTYICDDLLRDTLGIISKNAIDTSDSTYQKWTTDKDISLKDYLTYAASQNWIDISKFLQKEIHLDSDEVYQALTDYLIDYLKTDTNFSKLLYKYMLQEDTIPEARSVWCCMNREFYQKMMAVTRHCLRLHDSL